VDLRKLIPRLEQKWGVTRGLDFAVLGCSGVVWGLGSVAWAGVCRVRIGGRFRGNSRDPDGKLNPKLKIINYAIRGLASSFSISGQDLMSDECQGRNLSVDGTDMVA
jgi:hypothetical protein